jgi:DegV family protein with EDD domain
MIKIVTDSTADIRPDLAPEVTVIPCFVEFGTASYLDGVDITREQFYARLSGTRLMPKTAAPGVGVFEETFRQVAGRADEVIALHAAATLSSLVSTAKLAARAVAPERISVFDSETVTMGLGWLCIAAARAARQGMSRENILKLLEEMKTRAHVFAALDTLEFLRRSGRVSWASAMMGQVLNIKPIVTVYRGVVNLMDRVRTRQRSIQRLVELATSLGPLDALAVLHTTAYDAAAQLARQLSHLAPPPIPVVEVTPVIGSHVGPNGLGLAAVAKRRG